MENLPSTSYTVIEAQLIDLMGDKRIENKTYEVLAPIVAEINSGRLISANVEPRMLKAFIYGDYTLSLVKFLEAGEPKLLVETFEL